MSTQPDQTQPDQTQPGQQCGCADFRSSRRTFLKGLTATAGATVLTGLVGDVFTQTSFAAVPGGNVLVVLSLRGGCDGLSLVVPHGDPAYATLRPRIAVPTSTLLAGDEMFGLHPSFAPLKQMWDDQRFGAVQAVGSRIPDRSHFSAMEQVEDAGPGSSARVGWINRMVGLSGAAGPNDAVQLGTSMLPTALVVRPRRSRSPGCRTSRCRAGTPASRRGPGSRYRRCGPTTPRRWGAACCRPWPPPTG